MPIASTPLSEVLENILQDERLQRAVVDALDECMAELASRWLWARSTALKVWDRESGTCAQTLEATAARSGRSRSRWMAGRSLRARTTTRVWGRESGACAQTLQGHGVSVVVRIC